MASLNYAEIRRYYLNENTRPGLLKHLQEGLTFDLDKLTTPIKKEELSIRKLFESTIKDGPELLRLMDEKKGGGFTVRELFESGAGMAVNTGDFANVTGQIVYNRTMEGYTFPTAIHPSLCETMNTDFLNGERMAGIGGIGASQIAVVGEGEQFPLLGVNEEYIDTVALNKRGFIVAITREMIIMDRTGLLLQRCSGGGEFMAINKEFRILSACTGQTNFNNYNRNGIAFNTFNTAGAFINEIVSNPLVDYKSLEQGDLLFNNITDPNTGLPVVLPAKQIIVPMPLLKTAQNILATTQVNLVDNSPVAQTLRAMFSNPVQRTMYGQAGPVILSNAYVQAVTGSATQWFYGNFPKSILYKQAWSLETTQAIDNNEDMFNRDIWQKHKVSECGAVQVWNPRYISKHNG